MLKKMMSSAAFGQIIILIVYLPILSLQGIEGKMFHNGANSRFAILGALILSLTYIPMMSALFLSKRQHKKNIADKLDGYFQRLYAPVIQLGKNWNTPVVGNIAVALLGITLVIFGRMGGEFIPQLQRRRLCLSLHTAARDIFNKNVENLHAGKPYYQNLFLK